MFNLLDTSAEAATGGANNGVFMWIFVGVLVVAVIVVWIINNRRYKKQQKDREEQMSSIAVGDRIVTIGLIEGEVVEIGDGTYVLKTGGENNFSYVRIQSGAIYQIQKPDTEVAGDIPTEPVTDTPAEPDTNSDSDPFSDYSDNQ